MFVFFALTASTPTGSEYNWLFVDIRATTTWLAVSTLSQLLRGDRVTEQEKQQGEWLKSKLFMGGLQPTHPRNSVLQKVIADLNPIVPSQYKLKVHLLIMAPCLYFSLFSFACFVLPLLFLFVCVRASLTCVFVFVAS